MAVSAAMSNAPVRLAMVCLGLLLPVAAEAKPVAPAPPRCLQPKPVNGLYEVPKQLGLRLGSSHIAVWEGCLGLEVDSFSPFLSVHVTPQGIVVEHDNHKRCRSGSSATFSTDRSGGLRLSVIDYSECSGGGRTQRFNDVLQRVGDVDARQASFPNRLLAVVARALELGARFSCIRPDATPARVKALTALGVPKCP